MFPAGAYLPCTVPGNVSCAVGRALAVEDRTVAVDDRLVVILAVEIWIEEKPNIVVVVCFAVVLEYVGTQLREITFMTARCEIQIIDVVGEINLSLFDGR